MMIFSKRPLGVTVLAILAFIGAIAGIAYLITFISSSWPIQLTQYFMRIMWIRAIIMAILLLSLAYGFFKGLLWSWFLGVIMLTIGIILHVHGTLTFLGTLSSYPDQLKNSMPYIIAVYIIPFLILVIYGLILFYLTKPHVKTYFSIGQPGDITSTVKESKRPLVFIAAVLVIIAGICIWGFTPSGDIDIISVSQKPENPQPGDTITVIAEISGGSPFLGVSASLRYPGIIDGVTSKDDNKYSFTFLYPFKDSTEKWYVISAGDKTSEVFEIGRVEKSNITSLSITEVIQTPGKPTTATSSVEISAKVTSNVTISKVTFEDMHFTEGGGGGSGSSSMRSRGNDTYEDIIRLDYYESGTRVFYRIKAVDESGNTAVTPVYTFTLTDPV